MFSCDLYVTPANITGVIDRLEKKELVERIRQQKDRRVALVTLTETGKDLSKKLPDPIENKLISGLISLGQEQVQALAEAMNRIIGLISAEKMEEVPPWSLTTNLTPKETNRGLNSIRGNRSSFLMKKNILHIERNSVGLKGDHLKSPERG